MGDCDDCYDSDPPSNRSYGDHCKDLSAQLDESRGNVSSFPLGMNIWADLCAEADKEFASDHSLIEFAIVHQEWRYYFKRNNSLPIESQAEFDYRESASISPLEKLLAKRKKQAESFKL